MRLSGLVFVSSLAIPVAATAQSSTPSASAPRTASAARRSGPIVLDGRLDEPAWAAATPSSGFLQSYPAPGKPAPDQTEFRVLYDDAALYVGIRLYDAHPDSIVGGLARRDATAATGIYSDWVHLIVDSYHDRRTAFRFSTTPRGVQKDVYTYNDGSEDLNWDAVWEVATRIDSLGWVAEYRIPLSQLRYGRTPRGVDHVWGFQVQRDIARRNERDTWTPWTPQDGAFVSRFGDLAGLADLASPERLEVLPYVSTRLTRAAGDTLNPFYRRSATKPSIGGDLKYGLPGGLTLSATVNPDFGQVEVDPAVVNLSAFETSFPEKRPFFLEGSDVFSFGQVARQNDYGGQSFLYSRRIGRQPQRAVSGAAYVDTPDQSTIAIAAKVTGKSGPWTVGLLDAVTTLQEAQVQGLDGSRFESPVEPLSNYFASRLKRDFRGGGTSVGVMLERTSRRLADSVFVPLLRSDATFGGVDFEHDMQKRNWILSGFLSGSDVRGSPQAIAATQRSSTHYFQRPDATWLTYDSTKTSMQGYMGEVALQKQGANFGSIAVKDASPGLELNDLGFVSSTGYRAISTLVGHQDYAAGAHLSSWSAFAYHNDAWNYGGQSIYRGYAARASATLLNLWGANIGTGYSPDFYDDQLLRGGPEGRQPASWYVSAGANSDSRRQVTATLSGGYTRDKLGGDRPQLSLGLDARPSSTVHLNFAPSWSRLHNTEQYVRSVGDANATDTYGRRYVFATLTQTTLSLDTRVDVTLTPALSFVMYAQPFVSAGRYEGFKEFLTPGTYQFAVYGENRGTIAYDDANRRYTVDPDGAGSSPAFTFSQPNFNIRSLRGNAVMRWDYRPGSSLFFVWQQQRSAFAPIGQFAAREDVRGIFDTQPENVFLVKATYWMSR